MESINPVSARRLEDLIRDGPPGLLIVCGPATGGRTQTIAPLICEAPLRRRVALEIESPIEMTAPQSRTH